MRSNHLSQLLIDLLNRARLTETRLGIEQPRAGSRGQFQGMHDQRCRASFAERPDPLLETYRDSLHCLSNRALREIGILVPQVGRNVCSTRREYHAVRSETVERAFFVENLLRISVEVAQLNNQVDSRRKSCRTK